MSCPGHLKFHTNREMFLSLDLHCRVGPRERQGHTQVCPERPGYLWLSSLLPQNRSPVCPSHSVPVLSGRLAPEGSSILLILLCSSTLWAVSPSPISPQQQQPSPQRMENSWRAGPCLSLSYLKGNSRACLPAQRLSFLLKTGLPSLSTRSPQQTCQDLPQVSDCLSPSPALPSSEARHWP